MSVQNHLAETCLHTGGAEDKARMDLLRQCCSLFQGSHTCHNYTRRHSVAYYTTCTLEVLRLACIQVVQKTRHAWIYFVNAAVCFRAAILFITTQNGACTACLLLRLMQSLIPVSALQEKVFGSEFSQFCLAGVVFLGNFLAYDQR